MALRSLQEQLEDIDAAIVAIERGAQSYTTGDGRSVTRANLAELYRRRDQLQSSVDQTTTGASRRRARFGGAG